MKRFSLILAPLLMLAQSTQTGVPWRASVTASLASSASTTFTVQQNGANVQNLSAAVISCGTNTFTVGQSANGTAATATALTQTITGTVATNANALVVLPPSPIQTPLTLTAWTASNVGTGMATTGVQPFSSVAVISLAGRSLNTNGTGQNYSFTVTNTGAMSCTLVIDVYGVQLQ